MLKPTSDIPIAQPEQEKNISEDYKRFLRDYQKGK